MDTLIVGAVIGIVVTLITSWFTARVNKSADTRTQLLLKIDEWVNEEYQSCQYLYYQIKGGGIIQIAKLESMVEKFAERWFGVAVALGNIKLSENLNLLTQDMNKYVLMCRNSSTDLETAAKTLWIKLSDEESNSMFTKITYTKNEIHKIIAQEMLRILPSWPERVWLWVKRKL